MFKKQGYTLAEVLIVLALLGILAAMLLPAIASVRPNRNKSMFRKAYYIAERMVYELVNDEDLYASAQGTKFGLDDTSLVRYNNKDFSGDTKFCELFARKVNTVNNTYHCTGKTPKGINSSTRGQFDETEPSFITTDGIAWYLPKSDFATPASGDPAQVSIYVDINGAKTPNCMCTPKSPVPAKNKCTSVCTKPDIYKINLLSDGRMFVDGVLETDYLESNTEFKDTTE